MEHRDRDDELSDDALLAGVALGDEHAALTFVRRYQRRLYGLALSILGDEGAAEDVAQEAFVRILRHAGAFDARRASVTTWTLTITRNLAIDALRIRRAIPVAPDDVLFLSLASREPTLDDALTRRSDVDAALAALATLPVEQRRCVILASLYGRTAAEIATVESIALGTAKSRIRLGLAKLREVVVGEAP
jgi:RNA polymerase sigma-70 factor (ECF subfamily)